MKRVSVEFSSLQTAGGTQDRQCGSYSGTLRQDSGAYVLCYSEGTGGAAVTVRAFADESAVKTERFEKHTNCLLIESGKCTHTMYKTDFGEMLLDVTAKSISVRPGSGGVRFAFSYDISQHGEQITQCSVDIKCKYL